MERIIFATKADAIAAGYVTAKKGDNVKDTSGPKSFGYRFTQYDDDGNVVRESVTVWFTDDLNQMRQPGCFVEMFPPKS